MRYVFGPVPSRRLGRSLGIDTVPSKTCNWNCVYCQLGRSRPVVNERKEYYPAEAIVSEVREFLAAHGPGAIDWVTFVASGEGTLHSRLGWLIRQVKALTEIPVAVITNGSLLCLAEVREDLAAADAVLPSLDAGSADLYRRIDRPHPALPFEGHLEGLVEFRRIYPGKLWVEVMLVQGWNDTEPALRELAAALKRIRPDEVHIVLPTRPAAEPWVRPPEEEGLMRARAILGGATRVISPAEGEFDLGGSEDPVEAILAIIARHPMREEELDRTLARWAPGRIREALEQLKRSGRAQQVLRQGVRFWTAAASYYPDQAPRGTASPAAPPAGKESSSTWPGRRTPLSE